MNSLLNKLRKLYKNLHKKDEVSRPYEIVQVATDIPGTNMFILVATNKPKI